MVKDSLKQLENFLIKEHFTKEEVIGGTNWYAPTCFWKNNRIDYIVPKKLFVTRGAEWPNSIINCLEEFKVHIRPSHLDFYIYIDSQPFYVEKKKNAPIHLRTHITDYDYVPNNSTFNISTDNVIFLKQVWREYRESLKNRIKAFKLELKEKLLLLDFDSEAFTKKLLENGFTQTLWSTQTYIRMSEKELKSEWCLKKPLIDGFTMTCGMEISNELAKQYNYRPWIYPRMTVRNEQGSLLYERDSYGHSLVADSEEDGKRLTNKYPLATLDALFDSVFSKEIFHFETCDPFDCIDRIVKLFKDVELSKEEEVISFNE